MSWTISDVINELVVPEEFHAELEAVADENGHVICFADDDTICFDDDAKEHMDFLDEPWALDILERAKASGLVVFGSLEGDNAGEFWGYSFAGGAVAAMDKVACLQAMAQKAEREAS